MGRSRGAAALAALVCGALLAAPSAQARDVDVHVALEDSNGYRMAIEAARGGGGIDIIIGKRERAGADLAPASVPQPEAAVAAPGLGKLDRVARRHRKGFLSVQVGSRHAFSDYGISGTVTRKRLFGRIGDFGR